MSLLLMKDKEPASLSSSSRGRRLRLLRQGMWRWETDRHYCL